MAFVYNNTPGGLDEEDHADHFDGEDSWAKMLNVLWNQRQDVE